MDGKIDIFTILFLVIAVVIILKLRSVLGRKTGDEDARIERYRAQERTRAAAAQASADKAVAMPRRETAEAPGGTQVTSTTADDDEARVRAFAASDPALAESLVAIHRVDASFDPETFLKGARQAYEMIVTAFAEGNRKILRNLLSREVFDGFSSAIGDRESRGEQIDQSFVGINRTDVLEAEVKGGMAQLTVKFVSELISATRDKAGVVVSGDPKRIKEVIDIWTFAREVASRDPNWKLVATQAPN